MATEGLTIAFHGPETVNGEIDVGRLGAALVAFGLLLDAAKAADPDLRGQPLNVAVVGTDEGSFDIQIILEGIGTAWDAVKAWATGPDGQAASVVLGAFLSNVLAFLALVKTSKGQRPEPVETSATDFTYEAPDGTRITCSIDVLKLLLSAQAVRSARDFVETLDDDVTSAVIVAQVGPRVELTKEDRPSFQLLARSLDTETDDEPARRETTISPGSAVFDGSGQWSIIEFGVKYKAKMNDADFTLLVQHENWPITASDEYRVELASTSHFTPTWQRRWDRSIERVISYRKAPGEPFRPLPHPRTEPSS